VDSTQKPTPTYWLPADSTKPYELLFRVGVPRELQDYTSWVVDITDTESGLGYQSRVDGRIQNPIHWDGFFSPTDKVKAGRQYRVRITLLYPGGKSIESTWAQFSVVVRFEDMDRKAEDATLAAYIIPSGALYYQGIVGSGVESLKFPVLSGEVTAALFDRHRLTLRLETSSHLLMHYEATSTAYFYSDVSFFYAVRVVGVNPRHKVQTWRPKYAGKDPNALAGLPLLYTPHSVMPYNLDIGVRGFFTVLRGFGDKLIDSAVARSFQGGTLTVSGDKEWGRYFFKGGFEGGYSFLRGSILQLGAHASASYDGFPFVMPGIQVRYSLLLGSAADDSFDGVLTGPVSNVRNQLLMIGLLLNFKL
jgi:hypothetical protein